MRSVLLVVVCLPLVLLFASDAPFQHKTHAKLQLACITCHPTATKSERAGFPTAAICQGCHNPAPAAAAKIPSQRVYHVPDFVIFSHARHAAKETGAIECARCHGPVYEREQLTAEVKHTMKACMDCHRERKASVTCTACHELGQ